MRSVQGFAALRVEGSILPAEFLEEVAALEAPRQSGADYGLSKSLSLRDEIGRYWRIASDRHERYARRKRRGDLARNRVCVDEWLVPFVSEVLGYRPLTRIRSRESPIPLKRLNRSRLKTSGIREENKHRDGRRAGSNGGGGGSNGGGVLGVPPPH